MVKVLLFLMNWESLLHVVGGRKHQPRRVFFWGTPARAERGLGQVGPVIQTCTLPKSVMTISEYYEDLYFIKSIC